VKEVTLEVKKGGHSLGVWLPSAIAREVHLHIDTKVKLTIVDEQIILILVLEEMLTLTDWLAKLNPKFHDEGMDTAESVGVET